MKYPSTILFAAIASFAPLSAELVVDEPAFGKSLGGWSKDDPKTVDYSLSGSLYRTYRPEISRTPEGGLFISIRIDHVRGWLSSDDHAMLEVTVDPQGIVSSAKSNVAIQGRSIASDVILGTNEAGKVVTGVDQAVQIGTDLVSDLSAKLLRENIVEAGRVSFPSALRHNYNLLYQALRLNGQPLLPIQTKVEPPPAGTKPTEATTASPEPPPAEATSHQARTDAPKDPPAEEKPPVAKPVPANAPLEVQPFDTSSGTADLKE